MNPTLARAIVGRDMTFAEARRAQMLASRTPPPPARSVDLVRSATRMSDDERFWLQVAHAVTEVVVAEHGPQEIALEKIRALPARSSLTMALGRGGTILVRLKSEDDE